LFSRFLQLATQISESLFSSLAEAVQVIALSNARRAELENDMEEVKAQLRSAKTKDFNAGRLFRLEIENGEFQRELDLYKSALEEARQQILSNAQHRHVELPLEIESLRRDLRAAESAVASAEASRDAAIQELQRLQFSLRSSVASSLPHPSPLVVLPDMHSGSTDAFPNISSSRSHYSHSSFIAAASSSPSAQSLINFSAHTTPRSAVLLPTHTPAPVSLAGIGIRLYLDSSGRLTVQESAFH
jgi:hypothetical protein